MLLVVQTIEASLDKTRFAKQTQTQIQSVWQEIDKFRYKSYDLTEEEIKII